MIGRDHSQLGRNVKEAVSRGNLALAVSRENPALRCEQVTGRRGGVGQGEWEECGEEGEEGRQGGREGCR